MKITNIFELSGMPQSEAEQEAIVNSAFNVHSIHVKDGESGRYFLVRVTTIDESQFGAVKKLSPEQDAGLMVSILDLIKDVKTDDN